MPRREVLSSGIVFLLCWGGLQLLVSSGSYWRDAGEFIISAFYLDIPHPAGFPLFVQLSNSFALLPWGPIAWRVNSFSAFIASLNAAALYYLTIRLCMNVTRISPGAANVLAMSAAFLFATMTPFLRQAITTEVYLLNCLVILILLLLYENYVRERDVRNLLAISFVAGLGLGNHAALALVLLPAVLVICSEWKAVRPIFLPALMFGLLGLSIYAFLPIRAQHALPLNTGEPKTLTRFISHITDARDRDLRVGEGESADLSIAKGGIVSAEAIGRNLQSDLRSIVREFTLLGVMAGFAGLGLIVFRRGRLGMLLGVAAAGTWFFFMGWDPDPWMPIFAALAAGFGVSCAWVSSWHASGRVQVLSAALLSVWLVLLPVSRRLAALDGQHIRSFNLPALVAENELKGLPRASVLLSEPSWFLHSYVHYIEGVRPDIMLVYQPSILFPSHFARVRLGGRQPQAFDSWDAGMLGLPGHLDRAAKFTSFVASRVPLVFEPNAATNEFFSSVARCDAGMLPNLQKGLPADLSSRCFDISQSRLQRLQSEIANGWNGFRSDSVHYFEGKLTTMAELFHFASRDGRGIALLESVCTSRESMCGLVPLNNLAALYLEQGRYREAAELLVRLTEEGHGAHPAVERNLEQALKNLDKDAVMELLKSSANGTLQSKLRAFS